MGMFYTLLTFDFVVMSAITCNPLRNSESSKNVQNTSAIFETLNTFDVLNTIQFMCRRNESKTGIKKLMYYCQELIKEKDNYLSLENFIDIKINDIRSGLVKLLNLENKAIVCKSLRHLLPIIMYGIFINDVNGSTENGNSRMDMIDELFKKKSDFLNNKNSSIEEKLQQLKTTTKIGRTNKKLLIKIPEHSEEEFSEISSSLLKNVETTVQLILPFIQELDCFHNLYKIDKVMTTNKFDRNILLLLILDEMKNMYKTECYVDVDEAKIFQNGDRSWIFESKYDSTPLQIVREINRMFVAIQNDLQSLFVKFVFVNNPKRFLRQSPNVSFVFYHTFNKYYDPDIWKSIGDETIIDYVSDSAKPITTSIDKVASNLLKTIQGITDGLAAFVKNSVRCRCRAYLNLMIKLNYCSMSVLATNVWEVRRLTVNEQEIRRLMVKELQQFEQDKIYSLLHDKIKKLGITKCFIGNDIGTIAELLDKDNDDKFFRSIYAIYWNQNAQSIAKAIEIIWNYTSSVGFMVEFGSMLLDIHQIQIHCESGMKFVENLVKWYKWSERVYEDHCFRDEYGENLSTFSENMKLSLKAMTDNPEMRLTLEWIMKMTYTLNDDLVDDLMMVHKNF